MAIEFQYDYCANHGHDWQQISSRKGKPMEENNRLPEWAIYYYQTEEYQCSICGMKTVM